ncbi:MAG: hypothetical protein M1823_002834 [Watsoniomyces obsoletus]|nr:MAG: hypothetical protein M1823_002834 [Watsoniomyces obsoletus]
MGVPFEALLPYGIMLTMFGITGAGLAAVRNIQNGGKAPRHGLDLWDRRSSDGSGSSLDWLSTRSNGQCGGSSRLRVKQSMEGE